MIRVADHSNNRGEAQSLGGEKYHRGSPRNGSILGDVTYTAIVDKGDVVNDFSLRDQYDQEQSLYSYLDKGPVVLFFYPAAMTKGCTMESCHFRDLANEFATLGAQRIGISADSVDKQHQFSELHAFDYPLLSDEEGKVARQFGVKRSFGPLPVKRWSFVIATDHSVLDVIKNEIRMEAHADRALEVLRSFAAQR